MKVNRKIMISILAVISAAGFIGATAIAQTGNRAANIKSKGIFNYQNGTVVLDAADLTYLANEIDILENTYKAKTVEGLNTMGTYYSADGNITHENSHSVITPDLARNLSFDQLAKGILESQSIPADKAYTDLNGQQYYKMFDGGLTTDPAKADGEGLHIQAATADSLSAGAAAWVDGQLLIGTGADNNSYYNKGYAQGIADGLDNANIEYTYHHHIDSCVNHVSGSCTVTWERTGFVKDNAYCGSCNHYVDTAYFTGRHSNPECNGSTLSSSSVGYCHSGGWHDDCRNDIPGNYNHSYSYDNYICGYTEGGIESAKITFNKSES